ncbi:TIGR02099 family protein [Luteimonas viscosa]|uniref:TIGR02099 family protein n=1 Tax=Luteimonas viscosa TaxID=1132694 RepID=A0A5D4XS07_9GAMM|nr:YhdP family protein [Luteimonas viscosa]TYT27359.1 TIGR02099 family protein [Luteimonas viscosa]
MTTPFRRRLRLARRGAWYAVALTLVFTALAVGALSRLLPLAERHPDRVATWLGERAGRPVAFDRLETEWTRRGPLLRVDGLRIGKGADTVRIGAAEILVSQYAGLLPGRSFTELRLRGLQLELERGDDGRWHVRGLPGSERPARDPFAALESLGELQVIGGRLTVSAPALGIETTLPKIDLRLQVDGDRVRAAARAWIDPAAAPLDLAIDLDRHGGDGRVHAAAMEAELAPWAPLLRHAGVGVASGTGSAQLWLQLRNRRVSRVTVDAALADVQLAGTPVAAGLAPPRLRFGQLEAKARWQLADQGWRVDAPRLRIAGDGGSQVLDGLAVAGGQRFALRAARLDAGPLLSVLALGDRLEPGLRNWLLAAAPDATLHDIAFERGADGRLRANARVEALRMASVGDTPGFAGLAGAFSGDAQGFRFEPDPAAKVRFDWPSGFGPPHTVTLRGEVAGWREGAGLRVGTPSLRVAGEGYAADVQGGMWFQNDGTRPFIDIAAAVEDAEVTVAKRFWVRHVMPDAAERWLDDALVAGRVREGRALISGDLDDWPFSTRRDRQHAGLFHADARLQGAVVKFHRDWPAVEDFDGEVDFVNDGFTVRGDGAVAGVEVRGVQAALAHYGRAPLEISARSAGDAGALLALLRRSPLRNGIEDTLDSLSASGPVAATFSMSLPLRGAGARPTIAGEVDLEGVRLADARWKLGFDQVRGRATYDRHGFDGSSLKAVREGRPGTLSLRAGQGHVRDPASAFEADLDGVLAANDLLQHAPQLDWLAPRVRGRSQWRVGVAIPRAVQAGAAAPARLQLRSNLVGTTLDLPEPLAKPAAEALPTTIATTLPLGDGELSVDLGGRLALRATTSPAGTGVRAVLGASRVTQPPPASGLAASGHAPVLDALAWATLASGSGGGDGAMPLRGIDITAARLRLLGADFADTRLLAGPAGDGTQVRFEGAALAGTLQLPRASAVPVSGRFARLHWQSATPLGRTATATATATEAANPPASPRPASGDSLDPSKVPPLRIDVDDFRFGTLALGRLELQTRATASGLEIERLQTRSDRQRIDAGGSWTGRGTSARTQLRVDADSRDFGELMAGLGFGTSIDGGEGTLRFSAQWPRSPADFALGAMQGELSLAIKDGRLVEVEPGAGRVLGLLSIAQLPRRLMLDFRDFFAKGFSFDRIGGSVRFAAGIARSDDMQIDGPAAEIIMRGRSDLRAQTHDQTIEVLPKTGNLLPAVGAIAGGPVGAAVGAVANAMLRRPLGGMGARTYRVTGPWKDPQVEVVEPANAPQAAAARRSAAPPRAQ